MESSEDRCEAVFLFAYKADIPEPSINVRFGATAEHHPRLFIPKISFGDIFISANKIWPQLTIGVPPVLLPRFFWC
jgi:hypothetical protein